MSIIFSQGPVIKDNMVTINVQLYKSLLENALSIKQSAEGVSHKHVFQKKLYDIHRNSTTPAESVQQLQVLLAWTELCAVMNEFDLNESFSKEL